MKRPLDLIQLKYYLFGLVLLVFLNPISAQFTTVSNDSNFTASSTNHTHDVFKKIQFRSRILRGITSNDAQVVARNELELYYLTTLALKITGGISWNNAIESNHHDLIAHSKLVGHNINLEELVADILFFLN